MRKRVVGRGLWIGLLLVAGPALAGMREVTLERRIDRAGLIVEGVVTGASSFYDGDGTQIFTAHAIEVHRVFKAGPGPARRLETVQVITPGGRIGNEWHVVRPSLSLGPGDRGVFFLGRGTADLGRPGGYRPVAGSQGFVRYEAPGQGADPFRRYPDLERDLHDPIRRRVGEVPAILRPGRLDAGPTESAPGGTAASHTINAVSPSTVHGGVQDTLTISGSGFGTFSGAATVFFDNADDGPGGAFGSVHPEHVVSWTDGSIQVLVPNALGGVAAGSGPVIVRDAAGADVVSGDSIAVDYCLDEIVTTAPAVLRMSLEEENGRGGYTFRYSTNTANNGVDFTTVTGAVDRFLDALEQWNCATGWNAEAFGTTTVNTTGNDGVNIISFDHDADPLPAGTLGRASNFFTSCGGDTWRLNGTDIRFQRDGTGADWYYGADPGGIGASDDDFLSVALHEQGHSHLLGHVNDPADPMYWRLTSGTTRRVLSAVDIAGGLDALTYSTAFDACGVTGMIPLDCAAAPTARFNADTLGACGSTLTVQFTDLSLDTPTSWDWTFGDGEISSERNPTHMYSGQGLYTVSFTATNGNGSDSVTKNDFIVLTDPPAAPSCTPGSSGHNDCCGIGIKNVTFNTIDHTTGTATDGDPIIEDFSCSHFTVLEPGTTYDISITTGTVNDEDVRVFIDWNDDGTLTAGEEVFSSLDTLEDHAGSVMVPAGAVQDTALRMRVLSDFAPANIGGPCENIDFGQAEDYAVVVASAAVPGAVPSSGTPLLLSHNSGDPAKIDLSWAPSCGAATDYTIHEGVVGSWYGHVGVACTTAGATALLGLTPGGGDRYYLVVPVSATEEGSYGPRTGGVERPPSSSACRPVQNTGACP